MKERGERERVRERVNAEKGGGKEGEREGREEREYIISHKRSQNTLSRCSPNIMQTSVVNKIQ